MTNSLFLVCPFFPLTDSCACWSFCFSSVWIYELPHSPLQLMTRPVRINEVTARAKNGKQQTVKWMKQKRFPSRKPFYDLVLTQRLLHCHNQRQPYASLKVLTIRDLYITKTAATHLVLHSTEHVWSLRSGYIPTSSYVEMTGIMQVKSAVFWNKGIFPFYMASYSAIHIVVTNLQY